MTHGSQFSRKLGHQMTNFPSSLAGEQMACMHGGSKRKEVEARVKTEKMSQHSSQLLRHVKVAGYARLLWWLSKSGQTRHKQLHLTPRTATRPTAADRDL